MALVTNNPTVAGGRVSDVDALKAKLQALEERLSITEETVRLLSKKSKPKPTEQYE